MKTLGTWTFDLLAKHPLALLAMAALGGILVTDGQPELGVTFALAAAIFLALTWLCPHFLWACVSAFLVFGFGHVLRWQQTFGHPLLSVMQDGESLAAEVTGRFLSGPTEAGEGARPEVRFLADDIRFLSRTWRITGPTELRLSGRLFSEGFVARGGRWHLSGSLQAPFLPPNPTSYDQRELALRSGVVATLALSTALPLEETFSWRLWRQEMAERSRAWISRQLAVGIEDDKNAVTLLRTMALGTAERDTAQLEEPFRNSGTLHVFAVSGLHVGLIGVIGWLVLKMLRIRKSAALLILIPLVFGYAFITGWRPSAARAAFMMALMVLAPLLDRRGRIVNAMGFAALALWVDDTHQTFQAGFQLSFLVLLSIAAFSQWVAQPFLPWARLDDLLPVSLADWKQRLAAQSREWFLMLGATSVAAWIGSVPLMLAHFRTFTPVALLANVILVPLSFASLACVAMSLLAAALGLTTMQTRINNANLLLAHAMTASAEMFAAVPGGNIALNTEPAAPTDPPTLIIPTLRPGEGASLLIAEGKNWWLDAASAKGCTRVLSPLMQRHGIQSVDGIILSHGDADHAGGAEKLFRRFDIPRLLIPLHEPWGLDSRETTLWKLTRSRHTRGAELFRAQTGDFYDLTRNVKMKVLHPSPEDRFDRADDRSLVARLEVAGTKLLWVGDAGFLTEKNLMKRLPKRELQSQLLLRGQHAHETGALPEFLAAVKPKVVITSNDPETPGEQMPAHLVDYCNQHEVHLLNVQECGQITLRFLPDEIMINTHLTGQEIRIKP